MTAPLNLFLLRHGQSEANTLQSASKQGDHSLYTDEVATYPDHSWRLSPLGVEQAQCAGAWLQEQQLQFHRYLVSPFTRTRETAAHLGLPQAAWEECRLARERSWGELGGLSRKAQQELYGQNHLLRTHDYLYWAPPAGESIASLAEGRVAALMRQLQEEAGGKNVILVTHGEFSWATRLLLEEWTDEEFNARDKDKSFKIHNAHVLHYSSISPEDKSSSDRLQWVRRAWPAGEAGALTMREEPWQSIHPRTYSNSELLAKAHARELRYH